MTLQRAAMLAGRNRFIVFAVVLLSAALSVSCGGSSKNSAFHNAYISLTRSGAVALLHITDSTGAISVVAQTPPVVGSSPAGIALHPSHKFLYVADSAQNIVSIFSIGSDGTLNQTGNTVPTDAGPMVLLIDPTGKFLLVLNTLSSDISVFSVDPNSGLLTQVGAPVPAGVSPTNMQMTPSGQFVYIANPNSGVILGFSLGADGTLSPIGTFLARVGASGIAIDAGNRLLYTANTSDNSVSAFTITGSGTLQTVIGSPYPAGTAPRGIGIDPATKFLYVANESSNNLNGFTIAADGELTAMPQVFTGTTGPVFLVVEPAGTYIYTGNTSGNSISGFSYDATTGALTAITGSPFSTGVPPGDMVIAH